MSLLERITKDIMAEMKKQDHARLEALRAIKAALLLEKASGANVELTPEKEVQILQRLIKQRMESAEIYKNEGRQDLYEKEVFEAEVIKTYLPAMLSPEEIEVKVKEIIERVGASTIKDMGKVMSVAVKELAGKADNKVVSDIVKSLLSK